MRRLLAPFSRITSAGTLIPEIDGLRFVAIGLVVLFHLDGTLRHYMGASVGADGSAVGAVALRGNFGVPLFFVISGFVLALPFARHYLRGAAPVRLRAYFLRRLTRLEPPYIASLLLASAALVLVKRQALSEVLPHLAASSVYLHNMVYGTMSTVNGVAWSLEIEVQFYILVPLLTRVFMVSGTARRRAIIIAAMLAFGSLGFIPEEQAGRLALSVPYHAQFFLAGFLLADLYIASWREAPAIARRWDLVTLVGWPLLYWVSLEPVRASFAFPFVTLALYTAALRGTFTRRIFRSPVLVVIGGMCYTIYLYHYPIITTIGRPFWGIGAQLGWSGYLLVQLAIAAVPLLLICGLLFATLERPFMRRDWVARLGARIQGARSAATARLLRWRPESVS